MFPLSIFSPGRVYVSTVVESALLPSANGQFGVLRGHCPLITSFQSGTVSYRTKDTDTVNRISVQDGFVKVQDDTVTILCRHAETLDADTSTSGT